MTFTLAVLIFISYMSSDIIFFMENLLQWLRKLIIRKLLLTLQKHDQFILIHISKSCLTVIYCQPSDE